MLQRASFGDETVVVTANLNGMTTIDTHQDAVRPFPWIGLFTLALAIFVSVTTEFLPTGLLPEMARDYHVSLSQIGLLVTIFAGTVVLATTPLSILTRDFSRKRLVVIVLLVIAFGAVLAAVAPTYGILVVARVIGG
ncbi:MAG: transporter, family, inner rane transport protein, partial [Actinomycetota bacterium]|nr:transporter, family, inner rane transport protein [Actinomycetota bacterium]